mgnify:CR=1 FL=1
MSTLSTEAQWLGITPKCLILKRFRIFKFPILTVCLLFQLYVYLFSCLFAFLSAVCLHFGQLFVYFWVWHVDFRSGSAANANIRASQLFNARGKKLVASQPLLSASKATQTSIGSSTSTSMASIKRVQENQSSVTMVHQAPSNGASSGNSVSVATSESNQKSVKDRTLFQRLFQR